MVVPNPERRYRIRAYAFIGGYVAINVAAIFGAFDDITQPARWALAVAVAAPIAGHIWALLTWMRDSDEFIRALTARRFILAAGLSIACFSAWGFAETYAHAPHAPGFLIYALLWAFFGVITPFVRTTR